MRTLWDFSFTTVSKDSVFFMMYMYRLVEPTTRIWLKTHGQTEHRKEKFGIYLYYKFPTGEYENWK